MRTSMRLLAAVILCGATQVLAADEQQRLTVGDFQVAYTTNFPMGVTWRGLPLIPRFDFNGATTDPDGNPVEGFNFVRNFDGGLRSGKRAVPGGYELFWSNKRYVWYRDGRRRTDRVAGEATLTMTVTPEAVRVSYTGHMPTNPGGAEISFFLDGRTLTGGTNAAYTATVRGEPKGGMLPLAPDHAIQIHAGITRLTVDGSETVFDLTMEPRSFNRPQDVHWQDFRTSDITPNCYRLVAVYQTDREFDLDYEWTLKVRPKKPATVSRPAIGQPLPPLDPLLRRPRRIAVQLGSPRRTRPAPEPKDPPPCPAALRAAVSPAGDIQIFDGTQCLVTNTSFTPFPLPVPTVEETRAGAAQHIVQRYAAPQGTLRLETVVRPDEAWMVWTVTARTNLATGYVAVSYPAAALPPPYLSYNSFNEQFWAEQTNMAIGPAYSLICGGQGDPREFSLGSGIAGPSAAPAPTTPLSAATDWMQQYSGGPLMAHVALPRLKAGETWIGVWRYTRSGSDPYPVTSFDATLEERGICSPLLPDIAADRFTIIPSRDTRYTHPGRPWQMRLKYLALDAADRTVAVRARVFDMWDREVGADQWRLRSGGRTFARLEIPVQTDVCGAYRVEIEYRGADDILRTRELVFTVLTEVPDDGQYHPDSTFGGALGWGDYVWTLARRCGLRWHRAWDALGTPRPELLLPRRGGPFQWARTDEGVAFAERYRMFDMLTIEPDTSAWLLELWNRGDYDAFVRATVEEYVRPLVERYKGKVKAWEISNEPYGRYRDHPDKWADLMKACYTAIKAIDPAARVVGTCGPPGAMGYSWYRNTFKHGTLDYQDAVSCHLYMFGPYVGGGIEMRCREYMREIRKVMRESGRERPLIDSETSLGPAPSLYRHPSHQRYIQFLAGDAPGDPVVAAQFYFKMLAIHLAENVKYSFHVFHGGLEYCLHTCEYDETPFSFLATQAALAKHLEGAEYLGDIAWHPELYAGLFRRGKRLSLVAWGPRFMRQDQAEVTLPVPAAMFEARDVFDNLLPVAGDRAHTRLTLTWEGFYLQTEKLTADELRQACAAATVNMQMTEATSTASLCGAFQGEKAGPAGRDDWVGFLPLDLSKAANRGFRDDVADDGKGGWTDEGANDLRYLPPGEWLINGVPFRILDPDRNGGTGCIVLRGGMHASAKAFPLQVAIDVGGKRLQKLHFLHTVTFGARGPAFKYVLHYRDGFVEEVPVECHRNVNDWWGRAEIPAAKPAWIGPNDINTSLRIYHFEHQIAHPKGAQAVLDRIDIISADQQPIPVVFAVTGVYAN